MTPRYSKTEFWVGKAYEEEFCELTGAESAGQSWERRHVDCFWGEKKIDIKGKKVGVSEGYLLVEFTNVSGARGWIRGEADAVAFRTDEYFLVVSRQLLLQLAYDSVAGHTDVVRRNGMGPSESVGRMVGRVGRRDVFTYVRLDEVLKLPHVKVWRGGGMEVFDGS